ncbi:MAG: putative FKBP-type peptidyl-prolyl cis-trans isomerase [Methanonatronarchaeales archaeon]|nr:putative FKBP-type peptidyl-prolyl cis-trans isomerase [Methanonatronarchaeales archaeon]
MENGDFVRVSFTGRVKDGPVFETTDEEVAEEEGIFDEDKEYGPRVVVLGQNTLLPGLEKAILEAEVEDSGEAEIPPEEAFGERREAAVISLSKREYDSRFDQPARRGTRVEMEGNTGTIISTVGGHVRIDFNHPLAGETVVYEYEVLEEVEDPVEKVESALENSTGSPGSEFDIEFEDGALEIRPPMPEFPKQGWLLGKGRMADTILSAIDVDEVRFVESFRSPEASGDAEETVDEPAEPEAEAPDEGPGEE